MLAELCKEGKLRTLWVLLSIPGVQIATASAPVTKTVVAQIVSVKNKETLTLFVGTQKKPVYEVALQDRYALYAALEYIARMHQQAVLGKISVVWKQVDFVRLSEFAALLNDAYQEFRRPADPVVADCIESIEMGKIPVRIHVQAHATQCLNGDVQPCAGAPKDIRIHVGSSDLYAGEQRCSLSYPPVYMRYEYMGGLFSARKVDTIAVGSPQDMQKLLRLKSLKDLLSVQLLIEGSIGNLLLAFHRWDTLKQEQAIEILLRYFTEKRGNLVSLRIVTQ